MDNEKPLILVDTSYLAHFNFYRLKSLKSKAGYTGVIYGFLNSILLIGQKFHTNQFVFCFDSEKSYRKRKYSWYKEHRRVNKTEAEKEELEKLYLQINELKNKVLPEIGFRNLIEQAGCESDDLIAKICIDYLQKIIIVSSDHDLFQCLYPHVFIFYPKTQKIYTGDDFFNEWGIPFWKWVWVKAYAGCSSDGVPGIEGVGEKTAVKFIKDELKKDSKIYQKIVSEEGKDIYKRNYKLVKIPISKTKPVKIIPDNLNLENFKKICEIYEFKSILKREKEWKEFIEGYKNNSIKIKISSSERAKRRAAVRIAKKKGFLL